MTTTKRRANADSAQLRRMYIDCRFGQLHLTTAYPASGGFDELTTLVFLHGEGGTGADFNPCAAQLGIDRSVYAPDLPGSGASDLKDGRATVAGHAGAIGDLIDQLRLKQVDLVGFGRGAAVAFELSATRPQDVRRLIVTGEPPNAASTKPLLQLDLDTARLADLDAGPLVAAIRNFLDRS
jgi:pimeloyl-ACP methyl ester carboxylesterase